MPAKKTSTISVKPILEAASRLGLNKKDIEPFGRNKAKIGMNRLKSFKKSGQGKLILIVPAKPVQSLRNNYSLVSERVAFSLSLLRKNTILCLPQVSLENMFMGDYCTGLFPFEDALIKSPDLANVSYAHNLIGSFLLNKYSNKGFSSAVSRIIWPKTYNVTDDSLKKVITGMDNSAKNPLLREEKFIHTVNSELIAAAAVSMDEADLLSRIGRIILAYTDDGKPVTVKDMKLDQTIAVLLGDCLKPGIIQTAKGDMVFLMTSPSSNVFSYGNLLAINAATNLADYVIAKTDYGMDLSLEKFMNYMCRIGSIRTDLIMLSVFVNELNYYGGCRGEMCMEKNLACLERGMPEFVNQIESVKKFGVPILVTVNENREITREERSIIEKFCSNAGARVVFNSFKSGNTKSWIELVKNLIDIIKTQKSYFKPIYDLNTSISQKVEILAKEIHNAERPFYSHTAERQLESYESTNISKLPVLIAKSPYYKSGNDSSFKINELKYYAGVEALCVICDDAEFMPGYHGEYEAERINAVLR
jgi:formate--tetrahydrofolate ligase